MKTIPIKKNKLGTFLDLSDVNIQENNFSGDFSDYTKEIGSFLSGSSVSIIINDSLVEDKHCFDQLYNFVKQELNQNNISLKKVISNNNQALVENTAEVTAQPMSSETESTASDKEIINTSEIPETLYIETNLRSGQLVRYPGNIFILGDVNPSAEIIAAGDIIVWGSLRGIAHAGADGDQQAKIIAMEITAGQIRIADKYATLPEEQNKDKKKEAFKVPELVKIENNEIIICKYDKRQSNSYNLR